MKQEQIVEFQKHYGRHRNPRFLPLPIEDLGQKGNKRAPIWGWMVSIGRLQRMKEYNLYMIDIVDRLRQRGLNVRWTVYGDGDLADQMKTAIQAKNLCDFIELKGVLPYADFAAALTNTYLFVGNGTAIIEAALCGVPSIVALAYDAEGLTYGPLYRFSFGNCGSLMETVPSSTVEAEIERILSMTDQQYDAECLTTRKYALRYEMDGTMEEFMNIVEGASPPKSAKGLCYWYYFQEFVRKVRDSLKK